MAGALRIVTVGRTRRGPYLDLEEDYLGRLARLAPVRREAVPASAARRAPDRRRDEARALLETLPAKGVRVALDLAGRAISSGTLRGDVARWRARGETTFVIGGPDGLDETVLAACEERLALGPLTLPHELALVVLLEQLWRALAAEENHPYTRH